MKNLPHKSPPMGRVCKRGHAVFGDNAIPKLIGSRTYNQCRLCRNLAEVQRRKFLREREANRIPYQKEYRHIIKNAV